MKPGRLGPSLPWLQAFKNTKFASFLKIGGLIPISQPSLCDLLGANTLSCARRFFFLLPSKALQFGWRPHSFALRASESNCVRTSPEGCDLEKKGMVGPARLSQWPSYPIGLCQ
jgi:hypothetical protein